MTPQGEDNWKLVPELSWTLLHVPFFFADINLYHFAAISHNHEYNSFIDFCEYF